MTLRFSQSPLAFVASCVLAFSLVLFAPALLALKLPIDDGIHRNMHPALGIYDSFGRWNRTIQLVYDPDGAPAAYSDNNKLLALVREAYGYWTAVSGVRFELIGVDAGARDDWDLDDPDAWDGLVRISWGDIGDAAGQAGPKGGWFDTDLGYFPFEDGSVELHNGDGVIESDADLVDVLVHELGHLLGLGHSDDPHSVMYANPYNFLRYPRADDIRAMQVLYGAPAVTIEPGNPIAAWQYLVPPAAASSATQFLFKPNAFDNRAAFISVNGSAVTGITASTPDDEFIMLNSGGFSGASGALELTGTVIVVDPSGYEYSRKEWDLACPATFNCGGAATSVTQTQIIKTMPGTWKVYVVDESAGASNARVLLDMSLPVSTTGSFNRAPRATLSAVPGASASQARFTLSATDPEGDAIEVVWHPPGLSGSPSEVRNTFASGGSASLNVNFPQAGAHTFFVEVRDNARRYGNGIGASAAGDGFQTLLRVTVTMPAASVQVVSTQESSSSALSQPLLLSVAKNNMPAGSLVANAGGLNLLSNASVGFTYGASSDQGATTKTNFRVGDNVIIAGNVIPLPSDLGKAAEVFVVVRTTIGGVDSWTYRNTSGKFVSWSVTIPTLQPAYTVSSLQASQAFEIHNGSLVAAQHRVYVGYRLTGGSTLFYTGQAHSITVGN